VNYGARYGNFDAKKVLPDRKTVARHVPDIVEQTKTEVRKELVMCEYIAVDD